MIEINDCNMPITEATEFFKSSNIQDEATLRKDGDFGIASPGWLFDETELLYWEVEFESRLTEEFDVRGHGNWPPVPVALKSVKFLVIWISPEGDQLLEGSRDWNAEGDTKAGVRTCGGCLVRFPWALAREKFNFSAIPL
jgi:hypothetical protein